MKQLLGGVILLCALCFPSRLQAVAAEPNYILVNCLAEKIRVEFIDADGKVSAVSTVKRGGETPIRRRRRFVIRTGTRTLEYRLPATLHVPLPKLGGAQKYEPVINGNWRVVVTGARTLG